MVVVMIDLCGGGVGGVSGGGNNSFVNFYSYNGGSGGDYHGCS